MLVKNDKNLIANAFAIAFSRFVLSERSSSCLFSPFLIFSKNGHNLSWNLLSRRETICARRKNDSWRYLPLERICLDARSSFSHLSLPLPFATSDFRSKKPSAAIIVRSRGTDHPTNLHFPSSPPLLASGGVFGEGGGVSRFCLVRHWNWWWRIPRDGRSTLGVFHFGVLGQVNNAIARLREEGMGEGGDLLFRELLNPMSFFTCASRATRRLQRGDTASERIGPFESSTAFPHPYCRSRREKNPLLSLSLSLFCCCLSSAAAFSNFPRARRDADAETSPRKRMRFWWCALTRGSLMTRTARNIARDTWFDPSRNRLTSDIFCNCRP